MKFRQNISQSLNAIQDNLLRAGITIFIIALGITALVVVMTTIEGVKSGMSNSFSTLGSNTFRIMNLSSQTRMHGKRGRGGRIKYPPITYTQAKDFQEQFQHMAVVSITGSGGGNNTVKYQQETTNAGIQLIGTDEHYLKAARYNVEEGRSLSAEDVSLGKNVTVLGANVKEALFPFESPLGKFISVNGNMYKVIGTFEKMGTTGMSGGDKIMNIPLSTLRAHNPNIGSLTLNVYLDDANRMNYIMEEARGILRVIRKLRPDLEDNFSIAKSDAFVEQLLDQLKLLTIAAQVIGIITLMGASVALLNVMLVSVTERTNEIGIRKALGATRNNIQVQFLMEAVVICQLGGMLGVFMGVSVGNLISNLLFTGTFVVPWNWVLIGLVACLIVGVGAGFYPAYKAAKVDPIESLRHV